MATESNLNNYTSNISGANIENSSNEINPESKSRLDEFSQPKKVYYLASCDENIQMLKKEQEEGLTNILLTLKKEHDNIKMESKRIADETERLEKKITMIQQMDAKTGKKNFDSKIENENIKKAIEATKERLKEEEYKKKTLTALLSKIKKDINLNEISLQKSYDKQNILNQRLQKEKLLQNEIKAKGNQIKSQIIIQQDKNKHDLGEYKLQVKYYNTIIDQKLEFIRAAEERKERQIKIAQDAKKTSGDKDENEKREKLEMLYLINNYLQKKMENELEKNKDIEEAFSKIRLICGTNNLKNIIDKIILKDKRYNYANQNLNTNDHRNAGNLDTVYSKNVAYTGTPGAISTDIQAFYDSDGKLNEFETSLFASNNGSHAKIYRLGANELLKVFSVPWDTYDLDMFKTFTSMDLPGFYTIYKLLYDKHTKLKAYTARSYDNEIDELFIDGTFKVCPKNWYQLLNIFGFIKKKNFYLPLTFILLNSKNEELYNECFSQLIKIIKAHTNWPNLCF